MLRPESAGLADRGRYRTATESIPESCLRAAATAHALPPAPAVRRAEGRDLDGLVRLEQRCFDLDRLSRRSLRHFLTRGPNGGRGVLLVAERAPGELAGYALVVFRKGSTAARLYSIAVDPAERRQGVGSLLLQAAERASAAAGADELRLEVRTDNRAAIAAYEGAGYRTIGRYEAYYEDNADALRLAKGLDAAAGKAPAGTARRRG